MAHMHITGWVLGLILIVLVALFNKQGKAKLGKILQMVLRLDYLLILISGGMLLTDYFKVSVGHTGELIFKIIAGLWVIIAMEMIGGKTSRNEAATSWWIQLIIAAAIAIGLGFFRLPLGILPN